MKNTANKGAAIERGKLLAKLRRMRRNVPDVEETVGYKWALDDLAAWVKESATRAQARPGGLGRKAKAMKAK